MRQPTAKQKWVVVAYWGAETTIEFYSDASKARSRGRNVEAQGADVVVAKTACLRLHGKPAAFGVGGRTSL